MIKLKTIKIVLITILVTLSVFFFIDQPTISSFAYTTECPDYMDDYECLDFLEAQADGIAKDKIDASNNLSSEQYNQLTLNQRITYINEQITQSEKNISILEVDIETKNVEIKILGKDIIETQNRINLITQEVNSLESSAEKRVTVAYKYSFITPLELILEERNFDTILRKMKYLATTRQKDREALEDMSDKRDVLEDEEVVLSQQKAEAQTKRNEIEEEKTNLFAEQEILSEQRTEQATLLAISQQKEAEYESEIEEYEEQAELITQQVTQLIINLFNSGTIKPNTPVSKGDVIGFQGHTGLSMGSHLHFELRKNGYVTNPYTSGHFVWPNLAGSGRFPEDSAIITQWPHSYGPAIDMVSGQSQYWSNDKYYTNSIACLGYYIPAGWYNLHGEGAPIRAVDDGLVTKVLTDQCGGRYVLIDHGDGYTSLYLHLRD